VPDFRPVGVVAVPAGEPLPERPSPDQCGAADLQWLVGRPRSEIPVPVNPAARRVTCTTCPMTEDFSPSRLNILYDQTTDRIRTVRCG
jgi:hypothetical protein